jgi:serine/threonine protein kinase
VIFEANYTPYLTVDSIFFDSLDNYSPTDEFAEIARRHCPPTWTFVPRGFWTHCSPVLEGFIKQGWKIHASATLSDAQQVLERLLPLLIGADIPFKFVSDRRMLRLSLSKTWSRTSSGKFITAYPQSDTAFLRIAKECAEACDGFRGPDVLTDQPVLGSRSVFYRYGGHRPDHVIDVFGRREALLQLPDGRSVSDARLPGGSVPSWLPDPFGVEGQSSDQPPLLNNRYEVTEVIRYSNFGGLYRARDHHSGNSVVIREARPFLGDATRGSSPAQLLSKERYTLDRLRSTGLVPLVVEMFEMWEHSFLVEEDLSAEPIWGYVMQLLFSEHDISAANSDALIAVVRAVADAVARVHEAGFILRDLTRTNVLVTSRGDIRLIDFEFAYDLTSTTPPIAGGTPGYCSPEQLRNATPSPADDCYAFGALVVDVVAGTAAGLVCNRAGVLRALLQTLRDRGLPDVLYDIAEGLTRESLNNRLNLSDVANALANVRERMPTRGHRRPSTFLPSIPESPVGDYRSIYLSALDYIDRQMTPERRDRLWPASPEVFATNPLQFQYGAAGIATVLCKERGSVDDTAVQWMRARLRTAEIPFGLYSGEAGLALAFELLGLHAEATRLLNRDVAPDKLCLACPGLYYGAAGWGLAQLHMWVNTGERAWLQRACATADALLRHACVNDGGCFWPEGDDINLGFGHGQSGIATFLLYAFAATGNESYLRTAISGVDFDYSHRVKTGSGLLWYARVGADPNMPKSPHMRHGSAGVGSAAIRCFAVTGDVRFLHMAERCAEATRDRHSNKIWQDYGLAGYGEYLLDLHSFTDDRQYLESAQFVANGICCHAIPAETGCAFLGANMLRISCDFGMGSAGICSFLGRLCNPGRPRLLMLDSLLGADKVRSTWQSPGA